MYILLALCIGLLSTHANAIELTLPIDCEVGKNCFIQNYVDQQPGEKHQDFMCRPLSYDGHKGTDFRIPVFTVEQETPNVLAAADGTVLSVRDGEIDALIGNKDKPDSTGKECGNGLVIKHADGWQTQYCHMKQSSVAVKAGDMVTVGDVLGQVGLSGKTEFPHLHLSVRNAKGDTIDPFTGEQMESGCSNNVSSLKPLWSAQTLAAMPVSAYGLIDASIADEMVTVQDVMLGKHHASGLSKDAPAIVVWAVAYGLTPDIGMTIMLFNPENQVMAQKTFKPERFNAQYIGMVGKRNSTDAPWPPGEYAAKIVIGNKPVHTITFTVE